MNYEIQVDDFQGPLDLLYKLVKKNKIEISEISLAEITEQYLAYIKNLSDFNLEQASEFMVLASELLEIKARLLLPDNTEDDEEVENSDLVDRLEEYELFKIIADKLEIYSKQAAESFQLPPKKELTSGIPKLKIEASPLELRDIYEIAIQSGEEEDKDLHYSEMRNINPDRLSVGDKREEINRLISRRPEGVKFRELLYNQDDILEIVVTLLGLLELMRLREIEVSQDKLFSEMEIRDKRQVV